MVKVGQEKEVFTYFIIGIPAGIKSIEYGKEWTGYACKQHARTGSELDIKQIKEDDVKFDFLSFATNKSIFSSCQFASGQKEHLEKRRIIFESPDSGARFGSVPPPCSEGRPEAQIGLCFLSFLL